VVARCVTFRDIFQGGVLRGRKYDTWSEYARNGNNYLRHLQHSQESCFLLDSWQGRDLRLTVRNTDLLCVLISGTDYTVMNFSILNKLAPQTITRHGGTTHSYFVSANGRRLTREWHENFKVTSIPEYRNHTFGHLVRKKYMRKYGWGTNLVRNINYDFQFNRNRLLNSDMFYIGKSRLRVYVTSTSTK
jgi:hypothetical protein